MKENEFLDGVSNIDPDIVERFVSMDNRLKRKSSKRSIWVRVGALAACFALIVGAVISAFIKPTPPTAGPDPLEPIPTWENAKYSASDIADVFAATLDGSTNAYTEVYIPDEKYLYIDEIPNEEFLPIYEYRRQDKELNETEFEDFFEKILPKLSKSLGITVNGEYSFIDRGEILRETLEICEKTGKYTLDIGQSTLKNRVYIYTSSSDGDRKIKLDGKTVQINQRLSDEAILASLESIKNKLFDIFGVSFKNAKITRRFNAYSKHGASAIYVYFYDEDAHPLNEYAILSDCITISFDNSENFQGDIVSDDILITASITYTKYRTDVAEKFARLGHEARISIEDAEKLLYRGYVFGGHSCPLCMAAQDKISFRNYDFVDLEYVYDAFSEEPTAVIPFYAFYKKIGIAQNGNAIYAKTYVPAIQVYGYEEYFESQAANHR